MNVSPPDPLVTFAYRGRGPSGQSVSGTIDAGDHAAATALLESLGVDVVELARVDRPRRGKPLSGGEFAAFNQQLAHLTRAGLPIESGLRLIAQESRGRLAQSIHRVADEVERGRPLGEAFKAHRGEFPPLYGELIDAGVAGNNLPAMLFNLSRHHELVGRLRNAVWQALAYPLVVLLALLLVMLVLSVWVIPQFQEIYQDFDTELPGLTLLLLRAADAAPVVLVALIVVVVAAPVGWRLLQASGHDAMVSDALGTPLPLIGPVLKRSLVARWCDAVRVGVEAGLDLPRSMRLAAQAIGSPGLARDTQRMAATLERGERIGEAGGLYVLPASVPAAMDLSTNQTQLADTLDTLTQMYRQQAEARMGFVTALMTPLLIGLLGVVIGFTVLALFLPLMRITTSIM